MAKYNKTKSNIIDDELEDVISDLKEERSRLSEELNRIKHTRKPRAPKDRTGQ